MKPWHHLDYDISHLVLSGFYAVLALFCVRSLCRCWWNKHLHMRWQKGFYPIMILGCLIRSIFFAMAPFVREGDFTMHNGINFLLNELPSFIFFMDYLIVLFLWMEIYHTAHFSEDSKRRFNILRPLFWAVICVMWTVVVLLFILDVSIMQPQHRKVSSTTNPIESSLMVLDGTMYMLCTIGFVIYGFLIYRTLAGIKFMTSTTMRIVRRIQLITLMVATCFTVRAAFVYWAAVPNSDFYDHWWFDGVFFFFGEWVPLLLLLVILHRDPRRSTTNLPSVTSSYQSQTNVHVEYTPKRPHSERSTLIQNTDFT